MIDKSKTHELMRTTKRPDGIWVRKVTKKPGRVAMPNRAIKLPGVKR